jgi:hypothetical protein
VRPETIIQRQIREYLSGKGLHSVHVPNGAVLSGDKVKRSRQMSALKQDGLLPGFPDLLIYADAGRIGHLEVKSPKGTQQATQKAVQAWLGALGHRYAVVRSVDDTEAALRAWGWSNG